MYMAKGHSKVAADASGIAGDALVNIGASFDDPLAVERVLQIQAKLHCRATDGMALWRARCGASRTPGSAGGSRKHVDRKVDGAPWPDPTRNERFGVQFGGHVTGTMRGSGTNWPENNGFGSMTVDMRG